MNRAAAFMLLGLMGPCFVTAQSVAPKEGAPVTIVPAPSNYLPGMNCPVDMRARPGNGVNVVVVKHPQKNIVPFQELLLTFGNRQSREIVAVSVTIRGFDATPRLILGADRSQDPSALAKTIDLKLNVATGKKAERDVTLQSFATISRVDLESIEYADGTIWKASSEQRCHIIPDRFQLVDASSN